MLVFWGTRDYGKVDAVCGSTPLAKQILPKGGMMHVATRFFYVQFIPLIPVGSMIILSRQGNQVYGVKCPLSIKSVITAWLRAICIAYGAGALAIGLAWTLDPAGGPGLATALATLASAPAAWAVAGMSYFSMGWARASYERALKLAEKAELNEKGMILLDMAYGRMAEEEGRRLLAEFAEMDAQIAAEQQALAQAQAEARSKAGSEPQAALPDPVPAAV